jgi:uncharacterized protein with FMN-binding domain
LAARAITSISLPKEKPMKKVLVVLGVVAAVVAVAVIAFVARYNKMVDTVGSMRVEDIDVSTIRDGTYSGSFGDFLVYVKANVRVKNGRISHIEIVDQRSGKGYEALETVDRIVEAQSPKVDAVSGATGSSRCIMIAVQNALADAPRREPVEEPAEADTAEVEQ